MRPADTWRDYELLDATNHQPAGALGQGFADPPRPAGHLEKRRGHE